MVFILVITYIICAGRKTAVCINVPAFCEGYCFDYGVIVNCDIFLSAENLIIFVFL